MKRYDRLTIFRNWHRVRALQLFRVRVQRYFEHFEYDDELPVDPESLRAARAEINRMLPRVVEIVEAADLGGSSMALTRQPAARAVEILQNIFAARESEAAYQEVLDVIDMALGVYDSNQFAAVLRTFNPLFYVMSALGFVAGLPRRALVAIGLVGQGSRIRPADLGRLEKALARLGSLEELIESRFAEMRNSQSRMLTDHAERLVDVAERVDFVERVLAQRPAPQMLEPGKKKEITPV